MTALIGYCGYSCDLYEARSNLGKMLVDAGKLPEWILEDEKRMA